jgi:NAD(P)-dependent dehydrogenase (short-subunit alcohol dehydrogenase family)
MPPRSVLVTGSSGGFGLETAAVLAARGWRVFATMRDPGRGAALERRLAADGSSAEVLRLDVTDSASVTEAVGVAIERTGGLDAVVNNAGVGDAGFFEDVDDEAVRTVLGTSCSGTLAVTRAALPAMRERGRGRSWSCPASVPSRPRRRSRSTRRPRGRWRGGPSRWPSRSRRPGSASCSSSRARTRPGSGGGADQPAAGQPVHGDRRPPRAAHPRLGRALRPRPARGGG